MAVASLLQTAKAIMQMEQNARVLTLYRTDNPGTEYLRAHAPHIMSQLEEYTLNWTLIPKAVVYNESNIHAMVPVYRDLLSVSTPELPKEVTVEEYKAIANRLYDFLENEVALVLANMPIPETETEVNLEDVAEGFEESDIGDYAGESSGEAPAETSNN